MLDALLPLQRDDFVDIFTAMSGLPVTIRLLDPLLHEFLPDYTELSMRVALARERGKDPGDDAELLEAVRRLHEANPMMGLRGVRLGIVLSGLYAMQVRALAQAVAELRRRGDDVVPEIMAPLVSTVQELQAVATEIDAALAEEAEASGAPLDALIGTMIELPAPR